MIRAVGSPGMVFAVWIFGGVLTMFGALSYAELSAAMPEAGGEYVYLTAAYGPLSGFLLGWTYTSVGFTASIAAKAAALFTYLADFFPGLNRVVYTLAIPIGPAGGPLEIHYGQLLGIVVIFCLASVNYVGVRAGGGVQLVTTTLKMLLIAGIIVVGLTSGQGSASNLHSATPATPGGVAGFFAALVAALWAYDGWNYAGMIGGEVERPGRTLPRVLILGTSAVIGIYLLTNLAYFYLLSGSAVGSSPRVAADAMRTAVGPAGGAIVSIAAIISIFASLNGSFLAGPRVPYAMARRGYFFAAMGRGFISHGHLHGVDLLWNDGRGGSGSSAEAPRDQPALPGSGLPTGTDPVCPSIHRAALFNADDIAAGIRHRFRLDCGRITLLLSLETGSETNPEWFPGRRRPRRYPGCIKSGQPRLILFRFQNKILEFSLQ